MCKVGIVYYLAVTLKRCSWLAFAAQGVNHASINKIVKEGRLVTTKEAFLCIKDEELDCVLRSAYIDFIISTLVDVNVEESGTSIENMWYTFVSLTHTHPHTLTHTVVYYEYCKFLLLSGYVFVC